MNISSVQTAWGYALWASGKTVNRAWKHIMFWKQHHSKLQVYSMWQNKCIMLSSYICYIFKNFCHTSSWLTSILPFLFISRIKLQMDFFISLWTDVWFWSTWRSLKIIQTWQIIRKIKQHIFQNAFWVYDGFILEQLTSCSCLWDLEVIWKNKMAFYKLGVHSTFINILCTWHV